jgi:uncharacterized membrane protein
MPQQVRPSHEDPVVEGASGLVGGPLGRHVATGRRGRLASPLVLLLIGTAFTVGLGYLQKYPCRSHPWTHGYQYTRMCYSDVFALYFAEGLNEGKVPYRDHPVEYPVLTGTVMWTASELVPAYTKVVDVVLPRPSPTAAFFDLTALMMLGGALVTTVALVRSAGHRPWDVALFAFAPVVVLHAVTNWDLLAVAFATLGIACWARRRPVLAGVCIGLGTAAKLYPILFLIPLLALCYRAGRVRDGLTTAATAVGTTLAVNVPFFFFSGRLLDPAEGDCHGYFQPERAWWQFINLNRCRVADWDSLWYAAQHWIQQKRPFGADPGFFFHRSTLNKWSAVLFVVAVCGIVALALVAPRRPRLPQLLFLTLSAFLLVNKVWSPQYVLWLVPLVALARPRWRMFLVWQATEVWLLFMRFFFFIHNDGLSAQPAKNIGVEPIWFLTAVGLRDAMLVVLMGSVVREIWQPHLDVVRRTGADDPAGGVLDEAEDRWEEPADSERLVPSGAM